jgi:adenosylcobinamide-GDP ribazoletransferase
MFQTVAFGGGWSRDEVLSIMKDSRIGTFGGVSLVLYIVAKLALLSDLGRKTSRWVAFGSTGAGPVLVVSHALARATSAPLVFSCQYIVDKDDAKGDFYSWFGRSRDLLSVQRLALSCVTALSIAAVVLGVDAALLGGIVVIVCILSARNYGNRVLGGVMGDFLGATICITELVLYFVFSICAAVLPDDGPIRLVRPQLLDSESPLGETMPLFKLAITVVLLFRVVRLLGALKSQAKVTVTAR